MVSDEPGRLQAVSGNYSFTLMTHQGRVRKNNEDNLIAAPPLGLWAVADGLGGHVAGEYASAVTLSSLVRSIRRGVSLVEAFEAAHRDILDAGVYGFGASGMGATLVALQTANDKYRVAWAGDCRAYLWNGSLTRLTRDHTLTAEPEAPGDRTSKDGKHSRLAGPLYKSLGSPAEKAVNADHIEGAWSPGDCILLCSDGLTDELSDEALATAFAGMEEPGQLAERLLTEALAAGGRDNTTLLLITLRGA